MIYGDYDVDGVSSIFVMLFVLQQFGVDIDFYIFNCFIEGYGLNKVVFDKINVGGYQLVIMVDIGILVVEEMVYVCELDFDLIIMDYYELGLILLDVYVIIYLKLLGSIYLFKELVGVGVVFKFVYVLLGEFLEYLLELVVIGMIVDLVFLVDENCLIVCKGFDYFKFMKCIGIEVLLSVCGVKCEEIIEDIIGFVMVFCINVVGCF